MVVMSLPRCLGPLRPWYVRMCMFICMHACMCVCVCFSVYVCMYVCVHACAQNVTHSTPTLRCKNDRKDSLLCSAVRLVRLRIRLLKSMHPRARAPVPVTLSVLSAVLCRAVCVRVCACE